MSTVFGRFIAAAMLFIFLAGCAGPAAAPTPSVPPTISIPAPAMTLPAPSVTLAATQPQIPAGAMVLDLQAAGTAAPDEYGSNSWWSDQDAELWQARHAQLGVRVMRIPAAQSLFEPVNDDDDPTHINPDGFLFRAPIPWFGRTLTLEKWLLSLKAQDITLMLHVPYLASWLSRHPADALSSPYPPADLAEYQEYIYALLAFVVDDLGYDPAKVILEPVNEPDLGCGQDANVSCFWRDWQESDLLAVLQSARRAAEEVDPAIRLVGVSECCGTQWTERLATNPETRDLLDGYSYHKYVQGYDYQDLIARGQRLLAYGKPVYINEYGSTQFWSDGIDGALWHARLLPKVFAAGINPLQYPVAEFPGMHAGYNNLGLFQDWDGDFQIKPAYWVYTHFYRLFGGGTILAHQEIGGAEVLAVKNSGGGEDWAAVWIVTGGPEMLAPVTLAFQNLPQAEMRLSVLNALDEPGPLTEQAVTGQATIFEYMPQPNAAVVVLLTGPDSRLLATMQP